MRTLKTITLFLCFLIASCDGPQNERPVTVAAILPLSGNAAHYGAYAREGIEIAYRDALEAGLNSANVKLVFEDSEGENAKAVSALKRVQLVQPVSAVFAMLSGNLLALKPLAQSQQFVLLNGAAISPMIDDANDFVFSVIPNAQIEGAFLAESAYARGRRRMAILYRNDQSGEAFLRAFQVRFEELGGKVLSVQTHLPNEIDYSPYLARLAALSEVEGVFMASYGPEVVLFMKKAREQGFKKEIYGYTAIYSAEVVKTGGLSVEGVVFSAPSFYRSGGSRADHLRRRLKEIFNSDDLNYYVASYYDAASLLFATLIKGAGHGAEIRSALAKQTEYEGASGRIIFSQTGAANIPLSLYTIRNGQFEPS